MVSHFSSKILRIIMKCYGLIEKHLKNIDEDIYLNNLRDIIESKKSQIKEKDEYKARFMLFKFAANKGYESEYINSVLGED
jgi:hypothetical protein